MLRTRGKGSQLKFRNRKQPSHPSLSGFHPWTFHSVSTENAFAKDTKKDHICDTCYLTELGMSKCHRDYTMVSFRCQPDGHIRWSFLINLFLWIRTDRQTHILFVCFLGECRRGHRAFAKPGSYPAPLERHLEKGKKNVMCLGIKTFNTAVLKPKTS